MINPERPKILLIGKNGQVGWELQRTLAPLGKVISVDQDELDLTAPDQIRTWVRRVKPKLVVNAAAYTAVDKAESEPELAMAVNGIAPGILAEEAKQIGAGLVHYSTDYVFDGTKESPYTEDDKPNPLNVYGKTKLAGEQAIHAVGVPHLILRTSWVYGLRGNNFLLTMLQLAKERDEIRVVDDQIGAPTWCRMIAEVTGQILAQLRLDLIEKGGLYHLTATGETSWYEFAREIMKSFNSTQYQPPRLNPIHTSDYILPANRPKNSRLHNNKLTNLFNIRLEIWTESLKLLSKEFKSYLNFLNIIW